MAEIYANSFLNVAGAATRDSTGPLFSTKGNNTTERIRQSYKIQGSKADRLGIYARIVEEKRMTGSKIPDIFSPLWTADTKAGIAETPLVRLIISYPSQDKFGVNGYQISYTELGSSKNDSCHLGMFTFTPLKWSGIANHEFGANAAISTTETNFHSPAFTFGQVQQASTQALLTVNGRTSYIDIRI